MNLGVDALRDEAQQMRYWLEVLKQEVCNQTPVTDPARFQSDVGSGYLAPVFSLDDAEVEAQAAVDAAFASMIDKHQREAVLDHHATPPHVLTVCCLRFPVCLRQRQLVVMRSWSRSRVAAWGSLYA